MAEFDPEKALLDFVFRHRLVVPELLVRTKEFSQWTVSRLEELLSKISEDGCLQPGPLYGTRQYFHLTPAGVSKAAAGLSEKDHVKIGRALSQPDKVKSFAIGAYCCFSKTERQLLTRADLTQYFPKLADPGLRTQCYIDCDHRRIGYIVVGDTGAKGHWRRLLSTVRRRLHGFKAMPAFAEMIDRQAFELGVVVATHEKAKRIGEGIQKITKTEGVGLHLRVVPELLQLIAPPPVPADRR